MIPIIPGLLIRDNAQAKPCGSVIYVHTLKHIVDTAAINPADGPYRLTVTAEPV